MKKNIIKISAIILMVISLTGCTKYVKINKNQIKNNETGQVLVKNILCKTDNIEKEYDKAFKEYYDKLDKDEKIKDKDKKEALNSIEKVTKEMNISKLQNCQDMKIVGTYDGLWTTFFVRPLAWIIINLGKLVKSYGLSLIIITILIRLIVWPFTKKTAMQSENLKKAQPELEKLEKKYRNKTDQQSQMQKSQEMLFIYKKYNINPMSSCLFAFIQIPLFFAFLEAINRIPAIFEETFLGFQLGTSPLTAILKGEYIYIILIVIIPVATYYSFKLNATASMNKEQEAQMKMMTNIMVVFMTITAGSISSGIAIYWIVSQLFTIAQNLLVKRSKDNVKNK